MVHELVKPETPIEQLEQWKHYGSAEYFAFVDFLLATPDATAEQIFERTGIRLSDFDWTEDDGEECGWSAEEFRHDAIADAFSSDFLNEYYCMAIQYGESLDPQGDGWTTAELHELYYYLKAVFDPPQRSPDFFTGCANGLGLLRQEQPV